MKINFQNVFLIILMITGCTKQDQIFIALFEGDHFEEKWAIETLNPDLPTDWSVHEYLTFEIKASTAQRWMLRIYDKTGLRELRMQPFQGVWIRISIPLKYIKEPNREGHDVASAGKIQLPFCCIGFTNRVGPISNIDSLGIIMYNPIESQTISIRNVQLTATPEDAILERNPVVVDEFGQWIPFDRYPVAESLRELESFWKEEERMLESDTNDSYFCLYGGYLKTKATATGFFRVEKIKDIWWLVDPDGHLFFSLGATTISGWNDTRYEGREEIFKARPPDFTDSKKFGTFADGKLLGREGFKSFYSWNLYRRFGADWYQKWIDLTIQRMDNWGLNTIGKWSDPDLEDSRQKVYTTFLRGFGIEEGIMGMPDIYSEKYITKVDSAVALQTDSRKDDPWLLGYYIGQEPPWVHRPLLICNLILEGPETAMQSKLIEYLDGNDSEERRSAFVYDTYEKFVSIISSSIRKHDPNHLILGYGFAGTAPDQVINASMNAFDIFSFTSFDYVANLKVIQRIYDLTGMPVLIGEFHFGTPARGMAAGLVQVNSLEERGVAYRYYVENTAIHPAIVGIHMFQWGDQPATGRMDGENYLQGFIDITDRPYEAMVDAIKITSRRLLDIHSGKEPPVNRKALIQ